MISTMQIGSLIMGTTASGYLFRDLGGFEFPNIRINVKEYGNYDGARLSSNLYGRRVFTINLFIFGSSASDYEDKRRALEQALSIRSGLKTLKITTRKGLSLKTDVIVTGLDMGYQTGKVTFSEARIELTAPYPYLKSQDIVNQIIPQFAGGGFAIPFAIPLDISAGASALETITNDGNGYAYPIITLNGQIQNPTLTDDTNSQQLTLTTNITDGNYVVIDCYNRTILYNGTTNYKQYLSGDWLVLPPGNSDIKLESASSNENASAVISYNHAYLGI